jgi:hypothetical protein
LLLLRNMQMVLTKRRELGPLVDVQTAVAKRDLKQIRFLRAVAGVE